MNLEMDEAFHAAVLAFAGGASSAVLVEGLGERAFCSGGDVKSVRSAVLAAPYTDAPPATHPAARVFQAEYNLMCDIAGCPAPYVSLCDGIWMGLGVGLAVHGDVRVVTEGTVFAMPECAIGLWPDVGFALPAARAPGALGLYLALTGARLTSPADLLHARLATHYVPRAHLPRLRAALAERGTEAALAAVQAVVAEHQAEPPEPSGIARLQPLVDHCFGPALLAAAPTGARSASAPSASLAQAVDGIAAALVGVMHDNSSGAGADGVSAAEAREFAVGALEALQRASPRSLAVTLRHFAAVAAAVRAGSGELATMRGMMEIEFRAAVRMVAAPDFIEGVRAALVDKDKAPRWTPAALGDVRDADIDALFMPLPDGQAHQLGSVTRPAVTGYLALMEEHGDSDLAHLYSTLDPLPDVGSSYQRPASPQGIISGLSSPADAYCCLQQALVADPGSASVSFRGRARWRPVTLCDYEVPVLDRSAAEVAGIDGSGGGVGGGSVRKRPASPDLNDWEQADPSAKAAWALDQAGSSPGSARKRRATAPGSGPWRPRSGVALKPTREEDFADCIVGLVSKTPGTPERAIRAALGDSIDTSRMLRQLVRDNVLLRSGQGGRRQPFSYHVAEREGSLRGLRGGHGTAPDRGAAEAPAGAPAKRTQAQVWELAKHSGTIGSRTGARSGASGGGGGGSGGGTWGRAIRRIGSSRRRRRGANESTRTCVYARSIFRLLLDAHKAGREGCHESAIRAALGNNQDTSKVLRKLLLEGLVRRMGTGGRKSPYLYQLTEEARTTRHYASPLPGEPDFVDLPASTLLQHPASGPSSGDEAADGDFGATGAGCTTTNNGVPGVCVGTHHAALYEPAAKRGQAGDPKGAPNARGVHAAPGMDGFRKTFGRQWAADSTAWHTGRSATVAPARSGCPKRRRSELPRDARPQPAPAPAGKSPPRGSMLPALPMATPLSPASGAAAATLHALTCAGLRDGDGARRPGGAGRPAWLWGPPPPRWGGGGREDPLDPAVSDSSEDEGVGDGGGPQRGRRKRCRRHWDASAPKGVTRASAFARNIWRLLVKAYREARPGVPESAIRSTLGNNQDTSKVLRKLLKDGLVLRLGAGGRKVPFTYQISSSGLATHHYASPKPGDADYGAHAARVAARGANCAR
ncbi:hypothetical protein WJX81_000590 [Elliptochloris bilobata]|uniref:3-hydroxyisobutyryl-CoA hydrolase n=1 Tax=Elliptochloris bilobata TaxID=381761 RepID=A0AAW1RWD4_9CHLO